MCYLAAPGEHHLSSSEEKNRYSTQKRGLGSSCMLSESLSDIPRALSTHSRLRAQIYTETLKKEKHCPVGFDKALWGGPNGSFTETNEQMVGKKQ